MSAKDWVSFAPCKGSTVVVLPVNTEMTYELNADAPDLARRGTVLVVDGKSTVRCVLNESDADQAAYLIALRLRSCKRPSDRGGDIGHPG